MRSHCGWTRPTESQAADVHAKYKQPFPDTTPGAISKRLLVRDEDVQGLDRSRPWPT
ncbi:hypothetical protein ACFS5L_18950 [Streptomyces phyllanthi]|uniref:hypothetical protein n=1 Tax=Streptomyces phyllanthi TaxID=1803180 RepID=UPI001D1433C5|nr:hypothetical protein [Streptomyces phyllanthi]